MNPTDPTRPRPSRIYDVEAEERRRREPVDVLDDERAHDDDDEYVSIPQRARGGPRLLAVAGVILVAIVVVVAAAGLWASRKIDPAGEPGASIGEIEIPQGSSTETISDLLADEGVITSAMLFRYYTSWKDAGPWKAGEYSEFRRDMSFDEAIAVLDDGPIPPKTNVVRVVEGARLVDALTSIAEQVPTVTVEQLNAALNSGQVRSKYKEAANVPSWEGFLFPDSYQVEEGSSATQILQVMATKMDQVLDELHYDRAETLQGRSPYQLIATGSLVEKEAGAPADERGKIARVIYNRLEEGEPLGIDAALLYGLDRSGGELSKSDIETDTPYNNRKRTGLPPTPIALPGRASLEAAIQPAEGPWKYYVLTSKDPPTHLFTDSYEEFTDAKADAQERGVF